MWVHEKRRPHPHTTKHNITRRVYLLLLRVRQQAEALLSQVRPQLLHQPFVVPRRLACRVWIGWIGGRGVEPRVVNHIHRARRTDRHTTHPTNDNDNPRPKNSQLYASTRPMSTLSPTSRVASASEITPSFS